MTPELPADETRITQLEAEVARLKKFIDDYDVMEPIELRDVKRERDGALAGQAILLKALQECHADKNDGLWGINIPAEARALLDRLQRAEAVASQINGLKTALCDSTVVLDNLRRGSHLRIGAEGCLSDEWGIVTTQIHKNQAVLRGEGFAAGEEGKA